MSTPLPLYTITVHATDTSADPGYFARVAFDGDLDDARQTPDCPSARDAYLAAWELIEEIESIAEGFGG